MRNALPKQTTLNVCKKKRGERMNREAYEQIEAHMLFHMKDSAHDSQHIYRVLYTALNIAAAEESVDYDVLIAACLLHDIGRQRQFDNPSLCHATEGGRMAFDYLLGIGWDVEKALHVRHCIESHRFRSDRPAQSMEAKILFDADKVDVTGATGIARTLLYKGEMGEPIYTPGEDGMPLDGTERTPISFFEEYKSKLEGLYNRFYTKRGAEIAIGRREAARRFYEDLLREVREPHALAVGLLDDILND